MTKNFKNKNKSDKKISKKNINDKNKSKIFFEKNVPYGGRVKSYEKNASELLDF